MKKKLFDARTMVKLTTSLYRKAIAEVMNINSRKFDLLQDMSFDLRRMDVIPPGPHDDAKYINLFQKKQDIADLYLQKVLSLSANKLECILHWHDLASPRRAAKTVEMIKDELARRSIFGDRTKTDTIKKHGNKRKGKARPSGKKATSKRRKASKNRRR